MHAEDAYGELLDAVERRGFPRELGALLATELKGEGSMRRMCAYLASHAPASAEELVDEALAIAQMRDAWTERKIAQHAEEKLSRFYNRERDAES